jgi:transcriptional regulator with XRE-family HTH domain
MDFKHRFKEERKNCGLNQTEFGKLFNLSKQAISSYENGGSSPSQETLRKFADFFDVSTDYLLGRTENRKGIVEPEGNLHKNNVEFKTYNEIIDALRHRLIEEGIIEKDKPIPEEVLKQIIKHGQDSALEILKLRKKQDN